MIPSTLLYIALLPIILADLNILVLVPDEFKDSARVSERQAFGEEAAVYNRTWGNPGSGSLCPNTAKCKTKYAGVVWIGFSKTTEDPRNVNVTMGQERFVCDIFAEPVDKEVWWFVDWGMGSSSVGPDEYNITCTRGPI